MKSPPSAPTKRILEKATIEHLDKDAITLARKKYKEKMNQEHIAEEVQGDRFSNSKPVIVKPGRRPFCKRAVRYGAQAEQNTVLPPCAHSAVLAFRELTSRRMPSDFTIETVHFLF